MFANAPTPLERLWQLRQNPAACLQQAGYTIPEGMNDPNQILAHLLQSGQVDQNRLNQLNQMAMMFRR